MYILQWNYFEESFDEQYKTDISSNNHINMIYEFLKRDISRTVFKKVFSSIGFKTNFQTWKSIVESKIIS